MRISYKVLTAKSSPEAQKVRGSVAMTSSPPQVRRSRMTSMQGGRVDDVTSSVMSSSSSGVRMRRGGNCAGKRRISKVQSWYDIKKNNKVGNFLFNKFVNFNNVLSLNDNTILVFFF